MRNPDFCICENKDADQLPGNREADQRFVFAIRIVQSLYFLNPKFQASNHLLSQYSLVLCRTWSETPKTGFLTTRLIYIVIVYFQAAQRGQVGDTSVIMNKIMRKNVGYTVLTFMKNQVLPGGKNELKIDTIRYFD